MAKKSILKELVELHGAALAVFQAGERATKKQWEALRQALNLPTGSQPGA